MRTPVDRKAQNEAKELRKFNRRLQKRKKTETNAAVVALLSSIRHRRANPGRTRGAKLLVEADESNSTDENGENSHTKAEEMHGNSRNLIGNSGHENIEYESVNVSESNLLMDIGENIHDDTRESFESEFCNEEVVQDAVDLSVHNGKSNESAVPKPQERKEINCRSFKEFFHSWVVEERIGTKRVTSFLKKFKGKFLHFDELPSDGRSLLHTPRRAVYLQLLNGEYYHFGLVNRIQETDKELDIFIDGFKPYENTVNGFWCILGRTSDGKGIETEPFPIGLFYGRGKPDPLGDFLKDLINEMQSDIVRKLKVYIIADEQARAYFKCVKQAGGYFACEFCYVKGQKIDNTMVYLDMNAPPRTNENFRNHKNSELKDVWEKYTQMESDEAVANELVTPSADENSENEDIGDFESDNENHHTSDIEESEEVRKRKILKSFAAPGPKKKYDEHNDLFESSPFEELDYLDMVFHIVLDQMHMQHLGIYKRILEFWYTAKGIGCKAHFGKSEREKFEQRIKELLSYIICEFVRGFRPMEDGTKKAVEYRLFGLYLCFVLAHGLVDELTDKNLRCLHIACRILADPYADDDDLDFADGLLRIFVKQSRTCYGRKFVVYNVHSLLHIVELRRRCGKPVDAFSCYPFESFIKKLNDDVHGQAKPLQQVVHRINERERLAKIKHVQPYVKEIKKVGMHREMKQTYDQDYFGDGKEFKEYIFSSFTLKKPNGHEIKDNIALLKDGRVLFIDNIVNIVGKGPGVIGRLFEDLDDLFSCKTPPCIELDNSNSSDYEEGGSYPCDSRRYSIYSSSGIANCVKFYSISEIASKCMCLPIFKCSEKNCYCKNSHQKIFAIYPLLHVVASQKHDIDSDINFDAVSDVFYQNETARK